MNVIGNSIEVYKNMAKSATQDSINYKKRIDKAIEYIEQVVDFVEVDIKETKRLEYLLDILKGSEQE